MSVESPSPAQDEGHLLRSAQDLSESGATWQLSPFMLSVVDLSNGKFLSVNPAWTHVLGYLPGEIIGQRYLDFLHPDDVERTMAGYAEVARGQPITGLANRHRAKT